jgi:hypothetical protein
MAIPTNARILIIEDEALISVMLQAMMQDLGLVIAGVALSTMKRCADRRAQPARHGRISKKGNRDARKMLGGGLVGKDGTGSASGILRSCSEQARRRGDRPQAGRDDMAHPIRRWRVRLRPPGVHCDEISQAGAEGRGAPGVRQGRPGRDYTSRHNS